MSWKVPTPTGINTNESLTALERAIYREILSLCRNEPGVYNFKMGGRFWSVSLQRGQCVFKKKQFADELGVSIGRITRGIAILNKTETPMETEARPFGMIVTMKEYDSIIKMETSTKTEAIYNENRSDNERRPNKNVLNVKNVKEIHFSNKKEDKITNSQPAISEEATEKGLQHIRNTFKEIGLKTPEEIKKTKGVIKDDDKTK